MIDVKLWLLYSNSWNHLTVCKKELRLGEEYYLQNVFTNHIYIYKQDLALDNLQELIFHKPQPNQTKLSFSLANISLPFSFFCNLTNHYLFLLISFYSFLIHSLLLYSFSFFFFHLFILQNNFLFSSSILHFLSIFIYPYNILPVFPDFTSTEPNYWSKSHNNT